MLHIWTYTYSGLYAFKIFIFWVGFQWNKNKFENVFGLEVSETWAALLTAGFPAPSQAPPLIPDAPPMAPHSLMAPDSGVGTSDGQHAAPWGWHRQNWTGTEVGPKTAQENALSPKPIQSFGPFSVPWTANTTLPQQTGWHTHPSWWLRSYRGSESSGCHRSRLCWAVESCSCWWCWQKIERHAPQRSWPGRWGHLHTQRFLLREIGTIVCAGEGEGTNKDAWPRRFYGQTPPMCSTIP